MRYLIDTNVISEVRKRHGANEGVRRFFRRTAALRSCRYLSAITVGELRRGVELLRFKGDLQQAAGMESWVESVLAEYRGNILPVNEAVGNAWARLRTPHPEPAIDKLIAATARVHGMTVVTRNIKDFAAAGVPLLNPFSD